MIKNPKVGQEVWLRRFYSHVGSGGRRSYCERGRIEVVRRDEVVFRSRYGYELIVSKTMIFASRQEASS